MVYFIALMVFIAVTNTMLGCAAHEEFVFRTDAPLLGGLADLQVVT